MMLTRQIGLALPLLGAAALGCTEAPEQGQHVLGQTSQAVLNGQASTIDNVVQVLIYESDPPGGCTGTVITPRWVLTAKHCAANATAEDVEIFTPSGVTSGVEEIHNHPEELVDVSLYLLKDHLTLPTTTYALYSGTLESVIGNPGRIVGYGGSPFFQQWVDQPLGQRPTSDRLLEYFPGPSGGTTTLGDSGGPVFMDINHTPVIVGVQVATFPGEGGAGIAEFAGYFRDWAIDLISQNDEGSEPLEDRTKPRIAAYTTESIAINDRAQVTWDEQNSTTRPPCNSGLYSCASIAHGSSSVLGADARVLSVLGSGRVTLRNGADVLGDMVTSVPPDIQQGAQIFGALYVSTSSWPHEAKTGGLDLGLDPGLTLSEQYTWFVGNQTGDWFLPPGNWASPVIQPGYKLTLTGPGNYFFHDMTIEPGAELIVPANEDEITRIYVLGNLYLKGQMHGGSASNTFLAIPNSTYVHVDGSMRATVVAPNARIELKQGQQANFFSKSLELHQANTIRASTRPIHPNYWAPHTDWHYEP